MTKTEAKTHRERHEFLHRALDELVADFILHNANKSPSDTTIMELITWSYKQTRESEDEPHARKEIK